MEGSERVEASLDVYTWIYSTSDILLGSEVLGPSSTAASDLAIAVFILYLVIDKK